jgi:Zn-dependent peptidase ImmA (M78 family)
MPAPRARRDPEQRAAEVLRDHVLDPLFAPVNVELVAKSCDAEVRYVTLDQDLSGMLIRDGDRKVIAVADHHPRVRRRYTIAHELGHLVMHPGRPYIVESSHAVRIDHRQNTPGFADQREEREANQFAAALLMPPGLISQHWGLQGGEVSKAMIAQMAALFDVSPIAMQYRLINLGLFIPHDAEEELQRPF